MTERQWLAGKDPDPMLGFLEQHIPVHEDEETDPFHTPAIRKVRLFACACCRHVEHLLADERSRNALDVMERFLDRRATKRQYERATNAASDVTWDYAEKVDGHLEAANAVYRALDDIVDDFTDASEVATEVIDAVLRTVPEGSRAYGKRRRDAITAEGAYQANVLRDIFGNPFRPVALDASWLTSDVLALAKGIYEDRAFDRMPILADALQDAGCASDAVLKHCRDAKQVHVRGCWVVDLLLGKGLAPAS
jgi:hypothetical protein